MERSGAVAIDGALWTPPAEVRERSVVGRFLGWLETHRGLRFDGYWDLWRWSVTDLEGFWSSVWDFFGVTAATSAERVLSSTEMPGARWFPGATVNYAAQALAAAPADTAVVSWSQTRGPVELTGAELADEVARVRAGLLRCGVGRRCRRRLCAQRG